MKQKPVVEVCPTEDLLTEQQAAEVLGLSKYFFQKNRQLKTRKTIPYIRLSHRCVRYRRTDILQWAASFRKS